MVIKDLIKLGIPAFSRGTQSVACVNGESKRAIVGRLLESIGLFVVLSLRY